MYDSPIETLSAALGAAIHRDLPDVEYKNRDWEHYKNTGEHCDISMKRRPNTRDISVDMFQQTWGSTALGYGGVGGAAMTTAYTVVVSTDTHACVYFGYDRLAYIIDLRNIGNRAAFEADLQDHCLVAVSQVGRYLNPPGTIEVKNRV